MPEERYPWQGDVLEVAELIWCAAHCHHILEPLTSESGPSVPDKKQPKETPNNNPLVSPSEGPKSDLSEPVETRASISVEPPDRSPPSELSNPAPAPQRASPVRIPDPFPLVEPLELAKSLLPLRKRVPGNIANELDIDETVEESAKACGLPQPIYRPPLQRWFELHLLVDISPSMEIWGDLTAGITNLFDWQGIFSDLRVWNFHTGQGPTPQLFIGNDETKRDIRSLIAPGHDRLFLVLTDTLGTAWRSGVAAEQLALLGEHHPVALAHMFHRDLWQRTAFEDSSLNPLYALSPGCSNRKMLVDDPELLNEGYFPFPILNINRFHLRTWAKFVTGGHTSIQGILLPPRELVEDDSSGDEEQSTTGIQDPSEILDDFLYWASEEAQDLAGVFAAIPLIPPVMRLAQQQFVPHTRYWHLAEVFFSGLIEKSELGPQSGDVNQKWYDFVPGVRALLLEQANVPFTSEVHRAISLYVEEEYNSPRDFGALIPNEAGTREVNGIDRTLYFAEVRGSVMKTWGGEYAQEGQILLDQVSDHIANISGNDRTEHPNDQKEIFKIPDLRSLTFSDARYIDPTATPTIQTETITVPTLTPKTPPDPPSLPTFDFTVAVYEREDEEWTIVRHPGTAFYIRELIPSRSIEDSDIALEMVSIPGGSFMMGSPENDKNRRDNESPQHEVTVSPFFMGRYPITQAQWRAVALLPQEGRDLKLNPSQFEGDLKPVEKVSWHDAVEFCARLSKATGRTYRLPTEAEWEYACRAGSQTPYNFGVTIESSLANFYGDNSSGRSKERGTKPVDYYGIANAYGLSDMHGNVWEWCQDHWHKNYKGAPQYGTVWLTEHEESPRVNRGGSWYCNPNNCRSACRDNGVPVIADDGLGFRVACSAPRTLLPSEPADVNLLGVHPKSPDLSQ